MNRQALEKRVANLERRLGGSRTQRRPRSARQTLAAEINELERRLDAMSYMDDEMMEPGQDDEMMEEDVTSMSYMDEDMMEPGQDEMLDAPVVDEMTVLDETGDIVEPAMDDEMVEEDVTSMSYMDDDMDEAGCGEVGMWASEQSPGVEDEITQDSLSEVEGEAHGEELTTDDSVEDAAPGGATASEYVRRLKRASARLDKVATYLEKNGRKDLALRIDKIADAIDARIKTRRV